MNIRFPIYVLIALSFGIGYLFSGFTEVLQAESPIIPMALIGTLLLNMQAAKCFLESKGL